MNLTTESIRPYLLMECISGSRAYGLETESSDTDIKGIFYLPRELYFGLNYIPQVNNDSNDIVFYELGRFVALLLASNPNILELLNSPEQAVLFRHPLLEAFKPEWFVSKACIKTFVRYAQGQIKKAYGLNKKIVNPVAPELKSILDFCYILEGSSSVPLSLWLGNRGWNQQYVGLVSVPHARDLYAVYYDETGLYEGVVRKNSATCVLLSSVPDDAPLLAYLSFNKDGYSTYCKNYQSYWQWVKNRNPARYNQNIGNDRNYDSKNMMHVFRLLYMALNIATMGKITVRCDNREELLDIKNGKFSYEYLLKQSERLIRRTEQAFDSCSLPEMTNEKAARAALLEIRYALYCPHF